MEPNPTELCESEGEPTSSGVTGIAPGDAGPEMGKGMGYFKRSIELWIMFLIADMAETFAS